MDDLEKPTPAGTPDNTGTPFDPAKHAKYRSGRAMKTRDGNWFQNKGRTPKGGNPGSTPSEPPKNGVSEGGNPVPAKAEKGGVPEAFDGWQQPPSGPVSEVGNPGSSAPKSTLGKVAGDAVDADGVPAAPEDKPAPAELATKAHKVVLAIEKAGRFFSPDLEHSPDERKELVDSWAEFYAAGGKGPELSPGWSLALSYGMLIVSRLERPTFRSRCLTIWKKISGK